MIFEVQFVGVDDELHFVFRRREKEGYQIVKVVDDRIWHGVDSSKDVFPRLCGFVDIDVWEGTESVGGRLGNGEHGFEEWGYER